MLQTRPHPFYTADCTDLNSLRDLLPWLRRDDLETELELSLLGKRVHFRTAGERLKFALGLEFVFNMVPLKIPKRTPPKTKKAPASRGRIC